MKLVKFTSEFVKINLSFFTVQVFCILGAMQICSHFFKIPEYFFSIYKILMLNNGFLGCFVLFKFSDIFSEMYDMSYSELHFFNSITHIFPVLYAYIFKRNKRLKSYHIFPSIFIVILHATLYTLIFNPEKVYFFTGYRNKKLFSMYLLTLPLSIILYQSKIMEK